MSEDDAARRDPAGDDPDDEDWFESALAEDQSGERSDRGEADPDSDGSDPDGGGFDAAESDPDELDAAFDAATRAASEGSNGHDEVAGTGEHTAEFAGGDDFGLAQPSGKGDLFEDDFASAFGGGGGSEEFDEADFESAIPRIDVGVEGLDRMIRGGVPRRHLMVAIGSAGTGKTTFGLQYLNHGLENGEKGVFITLEQTHESILDTAAEYGWDFETHEAEDRLAVIDLDPIEMANSLDNIRGELPTLIEEFDADRFVLDSVSLLEMMYDEQARRRTEIFDFTKSLKRAGVTTLLTSEADEDNPYASRHGIIEYLTDAVFLLRYVRGETDETRLAVEIQKIRNANHSRETKPYEITDEGISVYEQANIF